MERREIRGRFRSIPEKEEDLQKGCGNGKEEMYL